LKKKIFANERNKESEQIRFQRSVIREEYSLEERKEDVSLTRKQKGMK
jgi:hypothetical protein